MASSKTTEAYATPSALNYIRKLHDAWTNAQAQLTKSQTTLHNLQTEKKNIGDEFARVRSAQAEASKNMKEANDALEKVQKVVNFFKTRIVVTQDMTDNAYQMAVNIFEATEFLNQEGMERVEAIKKLVDDFNKQEANDTSQQWTSQFTTAIANAGAVGEAAFTASGKAVKAAFDAYLSNQQINAQTQAYLREFLIFEKQIRGVLTRLGRELALINRRFVLLLAKNDAIQVQVNELNSKVQGLEFEVAQYHAEYNAAQQGTEVTYTPPTSPAG
ncbi:MAG: hypothetical protein AAF798_17130 [Bacteroidota bacterium]